LFRFEKDIHIPRLNLWLDSKRKRDFGFISHAHSDHIARHKHILCTLPTAALLRTRLNGVSFQAIPFKESIFFDDARVTLYPAGHILGSAQVHIQQGDRSLLYTGDFRTLPAKTAEPFELVGADTIIMESTFGSPQYCMPPRDQVEDELIGICRSLLKQGRTPAVFAYTMGKGQEALKILSEAGLPLAVEYTILRLAKIYERFGVQFGEYEKYLPSDYQGRVLLLPAEFRFRREWSRMREVYSIFLSGWGMDETAVRRFGVDRVLPLSDHADYNELIGYVEKLRPSEIYCTHGFPEFVSILRNAGFRAFQLETWRQRELDLFIKPGA
jgi:Cft2 family RNA processing exonuclease